MYYNRSKEISNFNGVKDAWEISKKYTTILMKNQKNDDFITIFTVIHNQFISELRNKKLNRTSKKNYIQCWNTTLKTLMKNPKINIQRAAIRLLHQTNIQKCYKYSNKFD